MSESEWIPATLEKDGSTVDVKEVGLKIIHRGGGKKNVRRAPGTDVTKSGELGFVNLEVVLLSDPKIDYKFQFYEGDVEELDLVFDASRWLAAINHTYQIKVTSVGDGGKNCQVAVKRRDPAKVKMGMEQVVSALQAENQKGSPKGQEKK